MKSGFLAFWLSGLALSACAGPAEPQKRENAPAASEGVTTLSRFDPAKIDSAKAAIAAEPKVKDLSFDPSPLGIEWQIGVHSDGSSRQGFADYICGLLHDRQLVDQETEVRIVDIDKVAAGADFRTASLGAVSCSTGERLPV